MSTVDNDSALVRQALDGDREAFSDLVAPHWRRLLALARSIVADLEAEDVVQDALIKAWKKLGSLRDPRAFSAWLTRIVANAAVARARRRRFFEPIDERQLKRNLLERIPDRKSRTRSRLVLVAAAASLLAVLIGLENTRQPPPPVVAGGEVVHETGANVILVLREGREPIYVATETAHTYTGE